MNREVVPLCRMSAFEQSQPALFCFHFQWSLFACFGSSRLQDPPDWLSFRTTMTQAGSDWCAWRSLPTRVSFLQVILSLKLNEFESCESVRSSGITAKMKLCKTFLGECSLKPFTFSLTLSLPGL